jgi:hypothetical protein
VFHSIALHWANSTPLSSYLRAFSSYLLLRYLHKLKTSRPFLWDEIVKQPFVRNFLMVHTALSSFGCMNYLRIVYAFSFVASKTIGRLPYDRALHRRQQVTTFRFMYQNSIIIRHFLEKEDKNVRATPFAPLPLRHSYSVHVICEPRHVERFRHDTMYMYS